MRPLLFAVLGLIMGSFLTVIIPRLHEGQKGILWGRSECSNCKKRLGPLELIPLLSYLLQRGQCRHCKQKISAIYPVIELSTMLCFLWVETQFSLPLEWAFWSLHLWILLYIFFYDLRYKEVHDAIMLPALGLGLLSSFLIGDPISSLIGAGIGIGFFGLQFLASRGRWLGAGDILIGAYMGLLLGWEKMLVALFLSYILGSILGLLLIALKKVGPKTALPLGPFLVLGSMLALAQGETLIALFLGL